jgi:flavorubredoxin
MYDKTEQKVKEVIPLEKLTYVVFLHFEGDEWGGMDFLKAPKAKLLCSDLSSKLNLTGWYKVPALFGIMEREKQVEGFLIRNKQYYEMKMLQLLCPCFTLILH